jgi:hypothetical protein
MVRGGSSPLQRVHQWKYGESEGEEEVDKRSKMEGERKKKRSVPFNPVLHPPLAMVFLINK